MFRAVSWFYQSYINSKLHRPSCLICNIFQYVSQTASQTVANKDEQTFLLNITHCCPDQEIKLTLRTCTKFLPSLAALSKAKVHIFTSALCKVSDLKMGSIIKIKMKTISTVLVTRHTILQEWKWFRISFWSGEKDPKH